MVNAETMPSVDATVGQSLLKSEIVIRDVHIAFELPNDREQLSEHPLMTLCVFSIMKSVSNVPCLPEAIEDNPDIEGEIIAVSPECYIVDDDVAPTPSKLDLGR